MPRFLVFAGDDWYPRGGWEDQRGQYASEEEALAAAREACSGEGYWCDWAQLVELETGQVRRFRASYVSGSKPDRWEAVEDSVEDLEVEADDD